MYILSKLFVNKDGVRYYTFSELLCKYSVTTSREYRVFLCFISRGGGYGCSIFDCIVSFDRAHLVAYILKILRLSDLFGVSYSLFKVEFLT